METVDVLQKNFKKSTLKKIDLNNIPIIEADSYFNVVKIIGILKSHFCDRNIRILLRGQVKDYDYIQNPSFYRKITSKDRYILEKQNLDYKLKFLKHAELKIDNDSETLNMLAWKPILQHYEYKTRYLDLLDNIPIHR